MDLLVGFQVLEPFLDMLVSERGCAPLTRDAYLRDLKSFLKFLGGGDLFQVQRSDIEAYLESLHKAGLKTRTLARHISALRQFYDFWVREGKCASDPTRLIKPPPSPHSLPKYLSTQEVDTLLQAAHGDGTPEGSRLSCLLAVLYATGMRISEVLTLHVAHITPLIAAWKNLGAMPLQDTAPRFLYVVGKGGKERLVGVTGSAIAAIMTYLQHRPLFLAAKGDKNPYLFPSRGHQGYLTRQRVFQLLKGLALAVGIDPSRLSPHVIRHAFATHMLQGGADLTSLQRFLGHQDLSSTQIYTHVALDHLTKLVMTHHPLMGQDFATQDFVPHPAALQDEPQEEPQG